MKSPDPDTPRFPLICCSDTAPDTVLEAIGLSPLSRASGVPPDSAFAVVAAVLAGLAGSNGWLRDSLAPCRLAKLDLLTATEDFRLQRLIDRLADPLETLQQRLVANMGRNSPDAVELIACGALSSPTTLKLADQEMREKSLRSHLETLVNSSQPGASGSLLNDLAEDPTPARIEAVLHPQFMVKGTEGSTLNPLVENCHQRTALVIQPRMELARQGSEPSKVMKMLTSLLDGATVAKRPASVERGRNSSLLARAHTILALTKPEIDALHAMASTQLNRFLWLTEGEGQDISTTGDENGGEAFAVVGDEFDGHGIWGLVVGIDG